MSNHRSLLTAAKQAALGRNGWIIGSVADFLRLTEEEAREVQRRVETKRAHRHA